VARRTGIELVEDAAYDPAAWFTAVTDGEGLGRRCIGQRLMRTAEEAAARSDLAFSSTLSISPYQDHEAIRSAGEEAARRYDVEFLYEDLRPYYAVSRRLSKEWGIYRQKYCGCLYSERERSRKKLGKYPRSQ
jgi:predicted adenine nucleotide alpha hydrolase (AANH) superfamily ATPase